MKLVIPALILAFTSLASAETIVLKTGQRIETKGLRRSGDKIMGKIEVGETIGEVGHPITSIANIDFLKPQGIDAAAALLAQGQADKALAEITPVLGFYDQFRDIPGSWWAQAAVVKVSALAALGRDVEAEALATQVQKISTDPEATRALNLRIANSLVRKLDYDKANKLVDAVIKESGQPEVLADAWVTKGNILSAQKQWDGALLAYLHVPVFYQDEKLFVPPALLGSARAYRRLDDVDRAKKSLQDLIKTFPNSAEAAAAQTELRKL